jgi:Domain of unknown function (DUF4124)
MPWSILVIVVVGALVAPLTVHAQIYRWINEKGVVTYGNAPPSHAREVRRVDIDGSGWSGIQRTPPSATLVQPVRPSWDTQTSRGWPSSVDRTTLDAAASYLMWRDRCFAERRGDCANPSAGTQDARPSDVPSDASARQ